MCRQHSCIPQLLFILYCKWFSGLGLSSHSICTKFAKVVITCHKKLEIWMLFIKQVERMLLSLSHVPLQPTQQQIDRFRRVFIAICLSCGDNLLLKPPRQFLAIVTQQNACRAYFLGVSEIVGHLPLTKVFYCPPSYNLRVFRAKRFLVRLNALLGALESPLPLPLFGGRASCLLFLFAIGFLTVFVLLSGNKPSVSETGDDSPSSSQIPRSYGSFGFHSVITF